MKECVMGEKVKKLCKWKKEHYKEDFKELISAVVPVGFICQKCGRAAVSKDYLCKPEKVKQVRKG